MTAEFDNDDLANQPRGLPRPVRVRVGLSWWVLAAERLWPALWPSSGIVGVFLILALANVFAALPEWLHLTALIAFAAAIVGAVVWSLREAAMPTRTRTGRGRPRGWLARSSLSNSAVTVDLELPAAL